MLTVRVKSSPVSGPCFFEALVDLIEQGNKKDASLEASVGVRGHLVLQDICRYADEFKNVSDEEFFDIMSELSELGVDLFEGDLEKSPDEGIEDTEEGTLWLERVSSLEQSLMKIAFHIRQGDVRFILK